MNPVVIRQILATPFALIAYFFAVIVWLIVADDGEAFDTFYKTRL